MVNIQKCASKFIYTAKDIKENKNYKDNSNRKLCVLNSEKNKELSLVRVSPQNREKHQGYKFLIKSHGGTSHKAFNTKQGLNNWLKDTGLKQGDKLGIKNWSSLKGSYEEISLAGNKKLLNEFGKSNKLKPTKVLDNGEYTRGYIQKGKKGNKIYYLNVNYPRAKLRYTRP